MSALREATKRVETAKPERCVPLRRVLLAEQLPLRSASTINVDTEFNRVAITTEFSMGAGSSDTREWLEFVRRNDTPVLDRCSTAADIFLQRQLHLAGAFGCTVVR